MTTPFHSSDRHFIQQSVVPALSAPGMAATRFAAAKFAAAKGHSVDSRYQPEPSGLTRGELRQIVLDILG